MQRAELIEPQDTHGIRILLLSGNPYQMGYQQGTLLKDKFKELYESKDPLISVALKAAKQYSPEGKDATKTYGDYALEFSYDFIKEECEGLMSGSGNLVTVEDCLILNSAPWILEDLLPRYFPGLEVLLGCSGFVVTGNATKAGQLIHGRNMDWLTMDFVMQYPLISIRTPTQGQRHATIAWPGLISAVTGINDAGIAVALDEVSCKEEYRDLSGVEPTQLIRKILTQAESLTQAEEMIRASDQACCELIVLSQGSTQQGLLFEINAKKIVSRELDDRGVVFATNHFVHSEMISSDINESQDDLNDNSVARYTRLKERLTGESLPPHPGLSLEAPDYAYGKITPEVSIDILRDSLDLRPDQNRLSFPCTEYQNGNWAIGNNHNVHSVFMIPQEYKLWLAAGWDEECKNAAYSPYIGFDLSKALAGEGPVQIISGFDPPYNSSYGTGIHVGE